MFSANTTQEKTIGLKEKWREEQKPANGVNHSRCHLESRERNVVCTVEGVEG